MGDQPPGTDRPSGSFLDTVARFIRTDLAHGEVEEELTPDTPLVETGLVDSLGLFLLIDFLRRDFGVDIRPDEVVLANFETIRAMERFVAGKQGEQGEQEP